MPNIGKFIFFNLQVLSKFFETVLNQVTESNLYATKCKFRDVYQRGKEIIVISLFEITKVGNKISLPNFGAIIFFNL